MKLLYTIIIMFIASFVIQFSLMSIIMTNKIGYVTNNLGKIYMSVIMALYMVILEVMMHDHQYGIFSAKMYLLYGSLLILFIYLYRNQVYISEKQYLENMIEHHSMALLSSEEILKKTDNYDITKLAKNILQTQNDEITYMNKILQKMKEV